MSEKPQAIATIKFFANKHVEVELSSIQGITPRTLEIAGNILLKTYRGNKAVFIAAQHKAAREAAEKNVVDTTKAEAKFHKDEDKRLEKATKSVFDKMKELVKEPKPKATSKAKATA